MSTAHVVVTLLAAALVGFSAVSVFAGAEWVVKPLVDYGIPGSWRVWLGTAKAAGAAGLVAGLFVPFIGVAAGIGLVLYFTGAVVTVLRARWFSHVPFPLVYVAPVIVSLALGFAA
ncbi:DoxX family protein [Actinoallomurus bryophytorum]|uniref:DoxX-like protein n=1 Tax=Actinoallomurus bryophytorum TaxID=1490222 RepID=A0A543BTF4_9ACTN|nr:DoxX family protein [Actinoallomurus bryophytorum]TQL88109.1 DoxX-like protein [Actinoallomurus bryophytorum]